MPKRAAFVTIISVSPMMALSGVRSSWLMLETNWDLFWLASASCRFLSWISSNSRTFSIAIAAWSANVDTSSICFSVNGRTVERSTQNADRDTFAQHRHAEDGAKAAQPLPVSQPVFRISQHIGNVNGLAFEQSASVNRRPLRLDRKVLDVIHEFVREAVGLGTDRTRRLSGE